MDEDSGASKIFQFPFSQAETQDTGLERQIIQAQIVPQQIQCKICLDHNHDQTLIQPCKCTGSLKYVHEECLRLWITRTRKLNKTYIQCQLCKHMIHFDLAEENECLGRQQLWKRIEKHPKMFIVINLVTVVSICLFIYLLVMTLHQNDFDLVQMALVVMSMGILFTVILVLSCVQIKHFYTSNKQQIANIQPYKKKKNIFPSKTRVFPQTVMIGIQ